MAKESLSELARKLAPYLAKLFYSGPTSSDVGGTTSNDHGALSGLGDDDHTQYWNNGARAWGATLYGGTTDAQDLELKTNNTTRIKASSAGVVTVGGAANYAQFAADGELTLAGTGRVTKCLQFEAPYLGKGGTAPDEAMLGNYIGDSYDIGDDSVITFKLPDDWAASTALTVGCRYYIDEDYGLGSGEVRFQAAWSAVPADASEAVDAPSHSGTAIGEDQDIPGTAKYLQAYTMGTIAGASLSAGDEIGITFERIALRDGNNPTADPVVTCVGVVYTADKLGTAT